MCGIAGLVNFDGSPPDKDVLERMASAMVLRGPDGAGVFTHGNTGLAHRRLAVIDLETGAQPMECEDGVIVFNGEIFNYRELKNAFIAGGEKFCTSSDTEVLLTTCGNFFSSTPEKLNGFFAFAYLNKHTDTLLLARDRFGVKPLFYFRTEKLFAFASELAALETLESFPHEIRMDAVGDYMRLGFVPREKTIYKNVFKLLPGHTLELETSTGATKLRKYYRTDLNEKSDMSYPEACASLRSLLDDAVEKRLVSDVPLGVFLSGGLDSAIVAALAAKKTHYPLECFSIGFSDKRYDESADASASAKYIMTHSAKHAIAHRLRTVDPCDLSILERLAVRTGEPFADASMIPTYLLSSFAGEHVTVAMTGDGADEMFAGYERYLAVKYLSLLRFIPKRMLGSFAKRLPDRGERAPVSRLKRFLAAGALPPESQYCELLTHSHGSVLKRILKKDVCLDDFSLDKLYTPSAHDPVEALMELDANIYLPDDILVKADTCSMASSLEARSPFLDCRVAEFAFSIPRVFKQKGSARKRILCDAFADIIPPGLAARRKRGFGVPVSEWFRGAWNVELKSRLLSWNNPFFGTDSIEKLIKEHENRASDHGTLLFYLLMFNIFTERIRVSWSMRGA